MRRILELIFQGQLPPGSRLPAERDLSEQLDVSRTTLRDALNQLRARGYVESRSKSGNYVCAVIPPNLRDPLADVVDANVVGLRDVIEVRRVLELWAVERAAERRTDETVAELSRCLRTMKRHRALEDEEQFVKHRNADLQFHQVLAEMTGNPVYVHLVHFLTHLISRSIAVSLQLSPDDFARRNLQVHEAIVRAVKAGDVAAARAAMVAHFEFVQQQLPESSRGGSG